jgi:hypothetical protein
METLTKFHLDRIKKLTRGAQKAVEGVQLTATPSKNDKQHYQVLDQVATALLLITENVNMIRKIEKLESADEEDQDSSVQAA